MDKEARDQVDQYGDEGRQHTPSELAPLAYFCFLGLSMVLLGFQPRLFFSLVQGFYICHLSLAFIYPGHLFCPLSATLLQCS